MIFDSLQFIKTVTFSRLVNYTKLILSYRLSLWRTDPVFWGQPANLSVEPTSVCNLACPECPSGNGTLARRKGHISWDVFTRSVDELKKTLFTTTLYFQGEPLLNKRIFDMIAYLKKENIYSIISTNAQFLHKAHCEKLVRSGLNRLIVSLDGLDQQTYETYRIGGSQQKVIEGIRNLIEVKNQLGLKNPVIILQFLVFRHNEHQVDQVKEIVNTLGVDKVWIKAPQLYDFEENGGMISSLPKYSRYIRDSEGNYQLKGERKNQCWRSWQNPVITVDGEMLPCCFDKDALHSYGNVQDDTPHAIWESNSSRGFKQSILQNRDQFDMCRNCTEGVRYLH